MIIAISASIIDESIFLVFLGFIPTISTFLIGYYYSTKLKEKIFLVPFISGIIFYVSGFLIPVIKDMEFGNLAMINIIFSIIVSVLFSEIKKVKNEKENKK